MQLKTAILSFNHPDLTAKSLRSTRGFFKDADITLLHNGSHPKNVAKLKAEFPHITHLELSENRGYTGGVNFLLNEVFNSTEWLLFLTNDCVLTQIPHTMPESPDLIAPLIWSRRIGKIDSFGGWLELKSGKLSHNKEVALPPPLGSKRYVPGTAFLIHREVFQKVGLFDESLGTYWEDVDFSLRALAKGYELKTMSDIQVIHSIGKTCHKDSHYTTYLFQRNRKIVCRRHVSFRHKLNFEMNYHLNLGQLALRKIRKQNYSDLKLLYKAYWDS